MIISKRFGCLFSNSGESSCFTKTKKIRSIVACSPNLIMSYNMTFLTLGKENPAEPLWGYTFLPQPLNHGLVCF